MKQPKDHGFAEPPKDERPIQTYEVTIISFATVVIEARDERQALNDAIYAADLGDGTLDEATAKLVPPDEVERAKRFADRFVALRMDG